MLTTQQVVDQVRNDAGRIERFVQRREIFLDTLAWTMLTCEQVHEAGMLDFMLEDDLAEALQRVSIAESLAAMRLPIVPSFSRSIRSRAPGTRNGWHL